MFKFVEFNQRRVLRGAEGARVEVITDDGTDLLWMSARDIVKNMMIHGRHPELVKAYLAYSTTQPQGTS